MKTRLAFVVTHPIPNQVALYRQLAAHPDIDLTVFFGSRWGLRPSYDRQFGRVVAWDVPLTAGYRRRFQRDVNLLRWPRPPIGLLNPALPSLVCFLASGNTRRCHIWKGRPFLVLLNAPSASSSRLHSATWLRSVMKSAI